jgi:hypothetical protein
MVAKFLLAVLTKASDSDAILVGVCEDEATMKQVCSNVAAPWFAENIRPYLDPPVARSVVEVIVGGGVRQP